MCYSDKMSKKSVIFTFIEQIFIFLHANFAQLSFCQFSDRDLNQARLLIACCYVKFRFLKTQ